LISIAQNQMFLGGAVSLGVGDGVEKSGVFLGGVVFIHDSRLDEVRRVSTSLRPVFMEFSE
jgi:hypothetical protein